MVFGAYWALTLNCYQRNGKLPKDDATLRKLSLMSVKQWSKYSHLVLNLFQTHPKDDSSLTHVRILEVLDEQSETSEVARNKVLKRWRKDTTVLPQQYSSNTMTRHDKTIQDNTVNNITHEEKNDEKPKTKNKQEHPLNWFKDDVAFQAEIQLLQNLEDFKHLAPEFILAQRRACLDWLHSSGRVYKDYRAFFRNWLRNSKLKNNGQSNQQTKSTIANPDQASINRKLAELVKSNFGTVISED